MLPGRQLGDADRPDAPRVARWDTGTVSEAITLPPSGHWTLSDLLDLPDTGTRNEIIDGALLMSPPPTVGHGNVAFRLHALLLDAAPGDLAVFGLAVGVQIGASVLIPDVLVADAAVAAAAPAAFDARHVRLVAEVLSPSNRTTDLVTKRSQYAGAGISHYWIVDPQVPSLTVLELSGDVYAEVAAVEGGATFTASEPFPVTIRPAHLNEPPTGRAGR
jgi:Uma2 family endonuclease